MKYPIIAFVVIIIAFAGMRCEEPVSAPIDHTIKLKWHKAYPSENWTIVREGLRWTLSYVGATLPKGSFDQTVPFKDSTIITLNLSKVGFSESALVVLDNIVERIKRTEEYQETGFIDLSRFVVLLIGVSENYYAITGVAPTLEEFIRNHQLENPLLFGVTKSAVGNHHRQIEFRGDTSDVMNYAFIAVESNGSLDSGTFRAEAFEVFDIMPNGQLRFAVYDAQGKLIEGSPKKLGEAGKPAKCMWCHEIQIATLFVPNVAVAGMLTNEDFTFWRSAFQRNLDKYRAQLQDDLDYNKTQDHTLMELLYISFMEPSAIRLGNEWNISPEEAQEKMGSAPDHEYHEFPHLGKLYYRYYADSVANKKSPVVPTSVREMYR
jgi:hypothetical protein